MDRSDSSHVNIVDIKVPFWSMVVFMVKAAIASIPAFIIVAVIGAVIAGVFGGILGGLGRF